MTGKGHIDPRADQYSDKPLWGVIAINGAALLGLSNIIANSPQPDQALSVLLLPGWLFVLGAAFAGWASIFQYKSIVGRQIARTQMEAFSKAQAAFERAPASRSDNTILVAVQMLIVANSLYRSSPNLDLKNLKEQFRTETDTFKAEFERDQRRICRFERLSGALTLLGIISFLGAFVVITVGSVTGVKMMRQIARDKNSLELTCSLPVSARNQGWELKCSGSIPHRVN